ncbi:MAG: lipopolysaccharide heptosyltransferase II [Nitrospinaceae bacterium]
MDPSPPTPLHDQDFHNILLWMPNWIGDVVLALPALQSLRKKYPHARITAVTKKPSDEILFYHPAIDTVLTMPSQENSGLLNKVRFARTLRKYRFDLGVVFPNSIQSAILLVLAGPKNRLGYNTEGRELFLTHALPVTSREKIAEYRVNYYFNILAPLKLDPPEMAFDSLKTRKADRSVQEILETIGLEENDFLIVLAPGASKPQRGWHAERYGILCQKLAKEYRVKFILLGSKADTALLENIRKFCPPDTAHILSGLHLRDIAALLETSRLFIGNDSGMIHLAAMMNSPVVGIFGPGSPGTSGPFIDPERQEMVTKNYPCSPCRQRFFRDCKPSPHNKPYCLEDIGVKDVSEAVGRILQKTAPRELVKK